MRSTTLIDENGHFVTIKAPEALPEGDAVETDHHDFLVEHWMDVAAASYFGFRKYGIGAVVVAQGDPAATTELDLPFETRELFYSRDDRGPWLHVQTSENLLEDWLDERMQTYDPNAEAVVILHDHDGSVRVYTVEGDPDPQTCFELVRARNN
jgi:hypothetical protein